MLTFLLVIKGIIFNPNIQMHILVLLISLTIYQSVTEYYHSNRFPFFLYIIL